MENLSVTVPDDVLSLTMNTRPSLRWTTAARSGGALADFERNGTQSRCV